MFPERNNYYDIRDSIQNGDIVFITNTTIMARIIQFVTRSTFSHVGIAFWAQIGQSRPVLFMLEAQGLTRRRVVSMSFYSQKQITVVESPCDINLYMTKAFDQLGEMKYGYFDAVYVGFREFLLNYLGLVLPPHDFFGEICSEFVARMLRLNHTQISPQRLYEQLRALGHQTRKVTS